MLDVSRYNDGLRGGQIKVRARISTLDSKPIVKTESPFGTNTSTLIDSILKSVDKGQIKVRKIDDNTAENVEILVHLAPEPHPTRPLMHYMHLPTVNLQSLRMPV